jgi:glutamate carboxypeptidase
MDRLAALRRRTDEMTDDLAALVGVESPSEDLAALAASADAVADVGSRLLGQAPERVEVDGRPHLRWRFGPEPRIVLLGHHDTVWPVGTLARWPFSVDRGTGTATGPGAFDMKAGIVIGFHALATLDRLDGLEVIVNADEEVGSQTSRALIERAATGARAAFVLEPAGGGAYKTARKGTGMYTFEVQGRAAHAGLEPEKGINALVEMSHLVLALEAIARPAVGTTVTPTVAAGGTTTNTVPARARLEIDVRVSEPGEAERVDEEIKAMATTHPGARLVVRGGPNRPPLPPTSSATLFARARRVADGLGLGPLKSVEVGGASDGNLTAAVGCPTLDGMGAVGDGAHAEGEHVVLAALAERAALVAALVDDLRTPG